MAGLLDFGDKSAEKGRLKSNFTLTAPVNLIHFGLV